jgi:hypothetical protein
MAERVPTFSTFDTKVFLCRHIEASWDEILKIFLGLPFPIPLRK